MPKIKTRKGISKRIRVARNGKLIRVRAWKSHLLVGKSAKRTRRLSSPAEVVPADSRAIRRVLGVWAVARAKHGVVAHRRGVERVIVAIDGPAGSGKSPGLREPPAPPRPPISHPELLAAGRGH